MAASLRPQSLDEMVGQEDLKKRARIAIGAALQRQEPLPHALLTSSGGGLGKTTFAQILANEMFSPITHTTGQCLPGASDLRRMLIQLEPKSLLHIDECHCIGRTAAEELLLVLEEGVLNVRLSDVIVRLAVPPFTLVCSTTRPSALSAPLRQRFGLHFHFDFYSLGELEQIVQRFAGHLGIGLEEPVCKEIARRGLGVPRICLRHAERVRDVAQAKGLQAATITELELAMQLEGVDRLGLQGDHRDLLRTLVAAGDRAVSARSLALALGIEADTVTGVLEAPLVRLGLMTIGGGGRRITRAGIEHLEGVARPAQEASILRVIGEQS